MTRIFNKASEKIKRKILRNNVTKAETILWSKLRNKQIFNYKFRRQYSIGPFVVDFYCPKLKLAIEIDGSSHFQSDELEYDKERQDYIEDKNIKFLRFINDDIYKKLDKIVKIIKNNVYPHPTLPLAKGEGEGGGRYERNK
ncbi:MAG: endonuclease domain-containing protein [Candidatus Parcubacteria bacterium]|nr:endonuclease domain-containing protein [Candidatus Parcubacteria bacterium]